MLCVCAFTFILMHRMLANGFIPLVDALQVKTVVERSGGNGQPGPRTHLVGDEVVLYTSYALFLVPLICKADTYFSCIYCLQVSNVLNTFVPCCKIQVKLLSN